MRVGSYIPNKICKKSAETKNISFLERKHKKIIHIGTYTYVHQLTLRNYLTGRQMIIFLHRNTDTISQLRHNTINRYEWYFMNYWVDQPFCWSEATITESSKEMWNITFEFQSWFIYPFLVVFENLLWYDIIKPLWQYEYFFTLGLALF